MEVLLSAMKPICVMSEPGAGRSTVVRDMILTQVLAFSTGLVVENITCSHRTNALSLKNALENNLVTKEA